MLFNDLSLRLDLLWNSEGTKLLIWIVIVGLVFTVPAKWMVELRAKIDHYRNRCLSNRSLIAFRLAFSREEQTKLLDGEQANVFMLYSNISFVYSSKINLFNEKRNNSSPKYKKKKLIYRLPLNVRPFRQGSGITWFCVELSYIIWQHIRVL